MNFSWKESGTPDFGLIAEEVADVEAKLVLRNKQGEIEGVKYDRLGVVLINAVKEQQAQIEQQDEQIKVQQNLIGKQQQQIDALTKFLCSQNPQAEICREKR